jgi:hypothetical protein
VCTPRTNGSGTSGSSISHFTVAGISLDLFGNWELFVIYIVLFALLLTAPYK